MARFDCTGLDDLIADMQREGVALDGELADAMLKAGAEKVREAWRQAAEMHNHRYTGDMIKSIGFPRKPKDVDGVRTIDIYPQGKDKKGVRNAEKAFVLHYGTSKITGSHWVDDADRLCDGTVVEAMQQVFNNRKGDN